jgi:transposase
MDKKTAILVMRREDNSINKICEILNISKNTVRKVIREEDVEYIPKQYQRKVTFYPKLQDYIHILEPMLIHDLKLEKKSQRSARRYHNQLEGIGYTGSYDSVRRYVKKYYEKHTTQLKGSFIPLYFAPAEAYQFDWSEETIELAGKITKIKLAHFKLSYSRMFFVVAYLRESQEMLFDAHDKAFEFFGGMTKRGIYDNMKTAVDKVFVSKYNRKFNQNFLCMLKHYVIEPTACNPASGWEKGQVENQVDNIRDWLFKPRLKFDTLEQLNEHLLQRVLDISKTRKHPEIKDKTIYDMFTQEKTLLREFIAPFNGYKEITRRADKTCLVSYDNNRYSLDCEYANRRVDVRAYPSKIRVFCDGKEIAKHARCLDRNKKILNPYHYLSLLERKPGALRNGEPFKDWNLPKSILKVKDILMSKNDGDRQAVEVLLALRDYGIEAVEVACDLAISSNVINSQHIINSITRLSCEENTSMLDVADSLKLTNPPIADCNNYDQLLGSI